MRYTARAPAHWSDKSDWSDMSDARQNTPCSTRQHKDNGRSAVRYRPFKSVSVRICPLDDIAPCGTLPVRQPTGRTSGKTYHAALADIKTMGDLLSVIVRLSPYLSVRQHRSMRLSARAPAHWSDMSDERQYTPCGTRRHKDNGRLVVRWATLLHEVHRTCASPQQTDTKKARCFRIALFDFQQQND